MTIKSIAKIAIAAGLLIAPIAQAHAYKLTYDSQTKKWSGRCVDGHQWVIGNGASQPTEEQAEKICAKHGGISVPGDGGQPARAAQKAVRGM